ncbi:MAG: hypothetical protein ACTHZ1_05900 [Sphingobacterium sp.]
MEKNVIPFFLGAILFLGACSKQGFLEQTETSDLNEEVVFSDSAYTMNFLSGIYSEIGFCNLAKKIWGRWSGR